MPTPQTPKPPAPNAYWVIPGSFAAGEYPGDFDPDRARLRIRRLLQAGISQFINLTAPNELPPYDEIAREEAHTLGLAIDHQRHTIGDLSVPDSPKSMAATLDAIDSAIADGKAVYLHCWAGVGRTGTVVGCWLVRHGHTGDQALAQIAQWWQNMDEIKRAAHPTSPETSLQRHYVRNWAEPFRKDS